LADIYKFHVNPSRRNWAAMCKQTDRQTERERERERVGGERERETDRQTDRQVVGQTNSLIPFQSNRVVLW
jgi:hypothetical protein